MNNFQGPGEVPGNKYTGMKGKLIGEHRIEKRILYLFYLNMLYLQKIYVNKSNCVFQFFRGSINRSKPIPSA